MATPKQFRRRGRWTLIIGTLLAALSLVGVALAFDSGGNPGALGDNTITWTGQGADDNPGELNTVQCDTDLPSGIDPGDPYLLWVFTTDGGSATITDPQGLHLGGTGSGDYSPDTNTGNTFKFVTPYFAPVVGDLTAYVDFTATAVPNTNSAWNLVISHGCPGGREAAAGPSVSKDASGSYDDTYTWTVKKDADKSSVTVNDVPGTPSSSTVTVKYTITDSHGESVDSNVKVTGTITVTNPDDATETLDSITDQLQDSSATKVAGCTVDTSDGLDVDPGTKEYPYSCDLTSVPTGDLFNYVQIKWSDQDVGTTQHLDAGDADFTTPDAITFTANEIDECDTLTDTYNPDGLPHQYCVGDEGQVDNGDGTYSFTFEYSKDLTVPALGSCVDYTNTATSTTNDTGKTPNDDATVRVCHYRAPLTIGYWKTHMYQCPTGVKTGTNGCNNNGPFTGQYLPQYLGTYYVDTTAKALAVFNANNCSNASTSDGNAVSCLAAQLLAAELNKANLADTSCIDTTITNANNFLINNVSPSYKGPGFTYTLNTRAQAITLKTALDSYNNFGC